METDSRGNHFIDIPVDAHEFIRATFVPSGKRATELSQLEFKSVTKTDIFAKVQRFR